MKLNEIGFQFMKELLGNKLKKIKFLKNNLEEDLKNTLQTKKQAKK